MYLASCLTPLWPWRCKECMTLACWYQPVKADSHTACCARAVPLPCRAAKGLECVFPIWFTQCGCVWFTLAMPCSDHAVLLKAMAQHDRLLMAVLCRGLEKKGMVRAWHGKCESHTSALCKSNGKDTFWTLSSTAWARHAMCESALRLRSVTSQTPKCE